MNLKKTLILTREEIARVMDFGDYVTAVESAFARHHAGGITLPSIGHIAAIEGAFHVKSAAFSEAPFYVAVKINGNFPDNVTRCGLPTIQGTVALCDGQNGFPLAVLDSTEITSQRTAAATAVAAKYLARPDSRVATVIGCGVQGQVQLRAALHVLPLTQVYAFDTDPMICECFAEKMASETGVPVVALREFAEGTLASDIIVTCTSSRTAFLGPQHVCPGVFVAAVGADSYNKQELHPSLLKDSRVIVDILEQCAQIGELHHALACGAMTSEDVHADLGQIVSGARRGRTSEQDIVIFDSTGSAIQDLASAGMIYDRALQENATTAVAFA